jgi:hypothetical protein
MIEVMIDGKQRGVQDGRGGSDPQIVLPHNTGCLTASERLRFVLAQTERINLGVSLDYLFMANIDRRQLS